MDTILPREQYILIYRISHILIFTSLYGIYNKHYILAADAASIYFSSILYWHNPDYSWRRYFDMTVAKTGILLQSILAYNAQYAIPYYCTTFIALSFYPLGIYYYSKKDYWRSTPSTHRNAYNNELGMYYPILWLSEPFAGSPIISLILYNGRRTTVFSN